MNVGNRASKTIQVIVADIQSIDSDRAAFWIKRTREQLYQSGFAGAIGTHYGEEFPWDNFERQVMYDLSSRSVSEVDMFKFYRESMIGRGGHCSIGWRFDLRLSI